MTDSKVAAALRDLRRELGESCPEECCAAACWNCYLCADCAPKWAAVEAYGEACREAGAEEKMMIYVCNDEKCGVIDHFTKHGVRYHRLLETELPPAMCGRHDEEVIATVATDRCPGCAIDAAARLAGIKQGRLDALGSDAQKYIDEAREEGRLAGRLEQVERDYEHACLGGNVGHAIQSWLRDERERLRREAGK